MKKLLFGLLFLTTGQVFASTCPTKLSFISFKPELSSNEDKQALIALIKDEVTPRRVFRA